MPNEESRLALLPTYLVLDTSASMSPTYGGAFPEAFNFLKVLLVEMNKSAVVADKLRVEVITFDEEANVVFPLGDRDQLRRWIEEKENNPIEPEGDWTRYSKAFAKIREEIENGVQQIRAEVFNNGAQAEHYKTYRPVVFFITDGAPNDFEDERVKEFNKLTNETFESRPNIICVGVGNAKLDDLKDYGAGKYKKDKYTVGNTNYVLVAKDGVMPAKALSSIIPALVASIVASVNTGTDNTGSDDDPADSMIENLDDDYEEEISKFFEQFEQEEQ